LSAWSIASFGLSASRNCPSGGSCRAESTNLIRLEAIGPISQPIPEPERRGDILRLLEGERSHTLTLDTILAALKAEREKIARAIAALQEGTTAAAPASGTAAPATRRRRRRRKLSTEERQRLSEAMRKWWAKRKRKAR
jgi:hypothetical protein